MWRSRASPRARLVIHATGLNVPDTTLNVTVTAPSLGTILIADATVGQNLAVPMSIAIPNPAPPGGLHVVLTSNDPNRVLLGRLTETGTASIAFTITEGLTGATGIYVQGLTLSGSANVTASATGYTSGVATITLSPSGFILVGPNGIGVPSFASSQGVTTLLTVQSARLDAGMNFVETQIVRGGATASVDISSSEYVGGQREHHTAGIHRRNGYRDHYSSPRVAQAPTSVTASVPFGFS